MARTGTGSGSAFGAASYHGYARRTKRIRNIFHRDGGTQTTYAAMVQSLDVNIGRVLQALDVSGLAGDTRSTSCSKAACASRR
jgi:hypothetical protein